MNLNLGCGSDKWGDVRVDIGFKTQTGPPSFPTILADAHHLPFRDKVFEFTRCFHVLEHLRFPLAVVEEIKRVSKRAELRFPVDDGYKREMIITLSRLAWPSLIHVYRTRAWKVHLWQIKPKTGHYGYAELFTFLRAGRFKSRLFKRVALPRIKREWIVDI